MKRDHLQIFKDAKQEKSSRTENASSSSSHDGPRIVTKEMFRKKLIDLILCTDEAFTLVEDPYFRDLIDFCSGSSNECQLFFATTAKKMIVDLYNEKQTELKSVLRNNESKISYFVDCWTSRNQFPFQGIIATWISND